MSTFINNSSQMLTNKKIKEIFSRLWHLCLVSSLLIAYRNIASGSLSDTDNFFLTSITWWDHKKHGNKAGPKGFEPST